MKNRLVVLLAGLSLGVLSACGAVPQEEPIRGEPAQIDPETHTAFCYACPVERLGQKTSMARVPVVDPTTGALLCPICDGGGYSYCGDGVCNGGETCSSCSYDCGSCPPFTYCGDGACNGSETSATCPGDCGSGTMTGPTLGRFSRWCGKVNIHQTVGGGWAWDSDCTSGCNIGGLSYCQKFWPNTTSIRQVPVSSKPNNVWANAGCQGIISDSDGQDEFECVGPPRVVGKISRWCGKVNIHQSTGGSWAWDSDCTSGCNIGGLSYCQKFWPNTTSIRQVSVSSKPNNVWANAGCQGIISDSDGQDEFECVVD